MIEVKYSRQVVVFQLDVLIIVTRFWTLKRSKSMTLFIFYTTITAYKVAGLVYK